MDPIIYVSDLSKIFTQSKHYRGFWGSFRNLISRQSYQVKAVEGVTFSICTGECVGYIGPNGAGKSTTIKILSGLLVPSGGKVVVNGHIPWRERIKYVAKIGVVFGQRTTLWWDLPVIESFELIRHIYKIPQYQYQANLNDFRELLELDAFIDTPVRSLSLGQRMRADICAALLHDPDILFLDEPTIGLDVVAKERIRQFIRQVNQSRKTTILLTTHDLSDVEKLCERVMILDKGHLLYDGSLHELQSKFGGKRKLMVDLTEDYPIIRVRGAELVSREGNRVTFAFERDKVTASELIQGLSERYRIRDLSVQEPEIENTVRRIYEEKLLDGELSK
jgi:ABC-2 type transport system ATP-binding protein